MPDALGLIMRWLHIASMATLIGGILYGRLVLAQASAALPADLREAFGERAAAAFRPIVWASVAGLIFSGVYNFLIRPGHGSFYHMLFGIKMLLALHVFAVSILIVRPKNPRRNRMMTGVLISGLVILFLSAWLRRIY